MKPPTPNPAAALDGGRPVLLTILARWPAASEPHCSALLFQPGKLKRL